MVRRRRSTSDVPQIKIVMRDILELTPYENNPRDNEEAVQSVANSISTFGFLVPMVVDGNGVIVAGHTRYAAAQSLGLLEVPTVVTENLTEDQIRQFRLIDNKVSEMARWDFDLLANELTALQESGINFTEFGWTNEEIDCLTDVVADDCLTTGSATYLEDQQNRRRQEARAPLRARFVLGEFTFFIDQETYRRWSAEVRTDCDYDEDSINDMLKERLGIAPYEG